MTIEAGDVLRVVAVMQQRGVDDLLNVFNVKYIDATPETDAHVVTALAQWLDDVFDCVDALMHDDVEFVNIMVSHVVTGNPIGEASWPTLTWGGAALHDLPHQISALASFPTSIAKRIGKKYFGGFCVDNITDDGFWDSTLTTAIVCAIAATLNAAHSWLYGDFDVGHVKENNDLQPWISGSADIVPRTQRRRTPGDGS